VSFAFCNASFFEFSFEIFGLPWINRRSARFPLHFGSTESRATKRQTGFRKWDGKIPTTGQLCADLI
jgi:hypothetical protein